MEHHILFIIRFTHILSGAIALLTGLAALANYGKTPLHKKLGKVFFYAMLVVFVTAVFLAIKGGIQFLFVIAVFSFYSVFNGLRAIRFLKGAGVHLADKAAAVALCLCSLYLIFMAAMSAMDGRVEGGLLFGFFGLLSLFFGLNSLRQLVVLSSRDLRWFTVHRSCMGGGLIATITAFSVTSLHFLPPLAAWLWPTIILSPALSLIINRSNAKFNTPSQPS